MTDHETTGDNPGTHVITAAQMMEAGIIISTDQIQAVEIARPPIVSITAEDGQNLVSIHPDGHLEYGPGYAPDTAARLFWETLERWARPVGVLRWGAPLNARINAELKAGQDAQAKLERVRAMHKRRTARHGSGCVQCGIVWPCPTYKALDDNPEPAT